MVNPSDASKAASLLHHTWGIAGYDKALEVYTLLGHHPELDVVDVLSMYDAGVWEPLAQLSQEEWWENVETLALSIEATRAYFQTKGETK